MKKYLALIVGFVAPLVGHAHVGYVLNGEGQKGADWSFFFSPLSEFINWILMAVTVLIVVGLFYVLRRRTVVQNVCDEVCQRGGGYAEFYPWMLRIALGISLIGAGSESVLISPIHSASALIGSIELVIGFLLFLGFATGFSALVSILLFAYGLISDQHLLGNLEFLAAGISLLALADTRPGIDHLLGIPFFPALRKIKEFVPVILRIGLGLAFLYLAIYEKFLNPHEAAMVVTKYNLDFMHVGEAMWVFSTGIIELAIALALIVGFMPRLISAVAFAVVCSTFFVFGESVYPHVTIFIILFILITTGGKRIESYESTK